MLINKVIHYCWFGDQELPVSVKKIIKTWKKHCPDYEIIEWNEANYVSDSPFVKRALKDKKWAFVSDYARLEILYKYGGIYLDTDVEIIRNLDSLLENSIYMGVEDKYSVATGLGMGAKKNSFQLKELMNIYDSLNVDLSYPTCVEVTTSYLKKYGFKSVEEIVNVNGITLYPTEYFCPQKPGSKRIAITNNTYSIHHYSGSWKNKNKLFKNINYRLIPFKKWLRRVIGNENYNSMISAKNKLKKGIEKR